ncbi:MAG: DUF4465 domain-containing protein [Tannerella sp.]|jgi:hypothetical protein|nr:DUF4465 domain-containing protein [Tannerella sp.]
MKKKILLCMLGIVTWIHNPLVAQETITLDLSAPVEPAEIVLDQEKGYWTEAFGEAPLVFEHFTFSHSGGMYGTSGYWSGFIVGSSGDADDYGSLNSSVGDWLSNQWGNMAGGGIQTDGDGSVLKDEDGRVQIEKGIPYLLANGSGGEPAITLDGEYEAVGIYLNNHPWPYYSNLYGDGFARALDQEGDYFKVTITGLNADSEETGTVEYLLAEYKDGALQQSTDWEWVDLSPLGKVNSLTFTLTSTDVGDWGMNTSAYFCLDKLQVRTTGAGGIIVPLPVTAQVYPNPVADQLTVTGSAIRQVTVIDLGGRLICQLQANGQSQLTIPVSRWGKGAYIVRITDATGTVSRKIVKK